MTERAQGTHYVLKWDCGACGAVNHSPPSERVSTCVRCTARNTVDLPMIAPEDEFVETI